MVGPPRSRGGHCHDRPRVRGGCDRERDRLVHGTVAGDTTSGTNGMVAGRSRGTSGIVGSVGVSSGRRGATTGSNSASGGVIGNDRRGRVCHRGRSRRDRRGTTRGRWRGCGCGGRSGCRGGGGVRRGGDGRRGGLGGRGGSQHGGGLERGGRRDGRRRSVVVGGSARLRPEPGRLRPEPGRRRSRVCCGRERVVGAAGRGRVLDLLWPVGPRRRWSHRWAPRRRPAPGPRGPAGSR